MSENQHPAGESAVKATVQESLDAFGTELARSCEVTDPNGVKRLAMPLLQMFVDLQVAQMKLEAVFEELGVEHCVDPAKLTVRLLKKIDRETKLLKQANDAKPNIAIANAVNGSLKGRG